MSYPPPKNWFMVSYMPPWKTSLSYSVCKKAFYFSVLQIPAAAGLFPSFCHYLASRRLVPRFGSARGRRFCRFVPNTQLGTPLKNQWLEDMTFPSNMVPFFWDMFIFRGYHKIKRKQQAVWRWKWIERSLETLWNEDRFWCFFRIWR